VLFFFNPFGRDSVRSILARLEASLSATPREVFVVYVNPRFESSALNAHFLRRVRKGGAWWRPWSRYVVYAASAAPKPSCPMHADWYGREKPRS
jgi:hypothetical protein